MKSSPIICLECMREMIALSTVFPVSLTVRLLSDPFFRKPR